MYIPPSTAPPPQHVFALMMSYPTPSQKKFQDAYEFLNENSGTLDTTFPGPFSFFVCFLRTLHNKHFIKKKSKKPIGKKEYKEEMEGVHNSDNVFMYHLNIKIDS